MKKHLSLRRIAALMLAVVLCMGLMEVPAIPGGTQTAWAAGAKLNKTELTTYRSRTVQLKVTGTNSTVTWSSSDKKIATVSNKGLVKAKKKGSCVIYAKTAGKTLKCKLTVKPALAISKTKMVLHVGETATVTVYYRLYGVIDIAPDTYCADITFSKKWNGSHNVMTVKAKKAGTTVFKFTNTKNSDTAKLTVKVLPKESEEESSEKTE